MNTCLLIRIKECFFKVRRSPWQGERDIEDPSLQGVRLNRIISGIGGDANTTRLSLAALINEYYSYNKCDFFITKGNTNRFTLINE